VRTAHLFGSTNGFGFGDGFALGDGAGLGEGTGRLGMGIAVVTGGLGGVFIGAFGDTTGILAAARAKSTTEIRTKRTMAIL